MGNASHDMSDSGRDEPSPLYGLKGRDVLSKIALVNAAKGAQEVAQIRATAFASIAMDFTNATQRVPASSSQAQSFCE